jgi:hypothetical protein
MASIAGDVGHDALSLGYRILLTALGAGVVFGRGLFQLASRLVPALNAGASARRHHTGRVRERVTAAQQAARASGLLARRGR